MLYSIELLRFFSCSLIVLHHCVTIRYGFPFGGWGVDIFFVISGYLMMERWTDTSLNFIGRRLVRITVLYAPVTIFAAFLGIILGLKSISFIDLLSSLTYTPNIRDPDLKPILSVGWSLNLEVLFYSIFSVLLSFKMRDRFVFGIILIFTVFVTWITLFFNTVSYYASSVFLFFAVGVLIKIFEFRMPEFPKGYKIVFFIICVISLFSFDLLLLGHENSDRFLVRLLPVCVLFILAQSLADVSEGTFFGVPVFKLCGAISFSMYLVHPFVVHIFSSLSLLPGFILTYLVSILISLVLYLWFERPMLDRVKRLSD